MWLIEKSKTIKENFLNFVQKVKTDIKNIKTTIKAIYKMIVSDVVDVAFFVIAVILSVVDFITTWDLTGAIALLTFYISGLLFRLAIWKLKNKQ